MIDVEAIDEKREAGFANHTVQTELIRQDIPDLIAEVRGLREAAKAYRQLCACYRLGKQPSEVLFSKLRKASKLMEES